MARNGNRPGGGAADSVSIDSAAEFTRQPISIQGTTAAARTRRASPKDRAQARAVATFTHQLARRDPGLNTTITLALISARFPRIRLDVALAGLVFRKLFLKQNREQQRGQA
jgi:hypothetical protein